MDRRRFLKRIAAAGVGASVMPAALTSCMKSQKPNIIYILADDLGYGDLSCYGQQYFKTPNIDRLATEGMKFTDHYAGSTVCSPSRCSLMTGYHTGHARVRGNYENGPHGFGACLELRKEDITVAEYMKSGGYTTGMYGKWGLGVMTTTGQPDKKGFDEWMGYLNQGNAHFYYPEYLWKNGEKLELDANKDGKRGQYSHDLIAAEALEFIKRHQDGPFFLYLPFTIPHAELLVPEDSMRPYLKLANGKPHYSEQDGGSGHYATQLHPHAAFAGMIERMDRDVGRILDLLNTLGIDNNTVVMFSSDNGPHLEGGADPDFFKSAGPLRGYKRDLYEGGIRMPFLVRWPGKVKPGRVSKYASAFWDFLPTACDLAGVPVPEGIDGISFKPELLGKFQPEHDYLYWEFHERPATTQAIRKGNWKAVRLSPSGPIELYDLSTDIGEKNNVAERHSEIVAQMQDLFAHARTDHELWHLKG